MSAFTSLLNLLRKILYNQFCTWFPTSVCVCVCVFQRLTVVLCRPSWTPQLAHLYEPLTCVTSRLPVCQVISFIVTCSTRLSHVKLMESGQTSNHASVRFTCLLSLYYWRSMVKRICQRAKCRVRWKTKRVKLSVFGERLLSLRADSLLL